MSSKVERILYMYVYSGARIRFGSHTLRVWKGSRATSVAIMHETQPVAPKSKHMKFLYTVGHGHVLSLAPDTMLGLDLARTHASHNGSGEHAIRLSVRTATRRHHDITQRQQTRRVLPTSSRQVEAHLPPRKRSAREDNGAREFAATCRQDKRLTEVLVRVRAVASTGHAYLQRFAVA